MSADGLGLNAVGALSFPFADETPSRAAALLAEAGAAYGDEARAETLLRAAQREEPQCLPAYFSLYKFYFYRHRLREAEQAVHDGLAVAATQGGFAADWRQLHVQDADWTVATGPVRFYLFSLKALAFICLRAQRAADAAAILTKLAELDPTDQVGGSVVRSLLPRSR